MNTPRASPGALPFQCFLVVSSRSLCWYPGHVADMMVDEWAHLVLVAALSHLDDTQLLRKSLLPELTVRKFLLLKHFDCCVLALGLYARKHFRNGGNLQAILFPNTVRGGQDGEGHLGRD